MDHQQFAQLLGNYGEFVGAFAVVGSLIYLSMQVRQSREAMLANTKSLRSVARIESTRYWTEEVIRMALSPDMAMIVSKGLVDARALPDVERERLVAWYTQHMIAKDNAYHQFMEGSLPPESWEAHQKVTIGLLQYDSFRRVWDAGCIPVSDEFFEYVEGLRRDHATSGWSYDAKARVFD